jgi:hypothetical protein
VVSASVKAQDTPEDALKCIAAATQHSTLPRLVLITVSG